MGLIFSKRVGTDPYYANYEKSFDRLEKECVLLGARRERRTVKTRSCTNTSNRILFLLTVLAVAYIAWVQRLPAGTLTLRQHLTRTSLAIAAPLVALLLRTVVLFLLRWAETRDAALLKKLHTNKRRMIKELKDSTRFEKTMALIKKFDPDVVPTPVAAPLPTPGSAMQGTAARRGLLARDAQGNQTPIAGGGFGTPLAAAGRALFPVFDKLASSVIGDNPMLLEDLRRAQQLAVSLQQQNDELRLKLQQLEGGAPSSDASDGAPLLLMDAPFESPAPHRLQRYSSGNSSALDNASQADDSVAGGTQGGQDGAVI